MVVNVFVSKWLTFLWRFIDYSRFWSTDFNSGCVKQNIYYFMLSFNQNMSFNAKMPTMSQNFGISISIYRKCFDPSDTFWTNKHLNCQKICGLLMILTRRCTKMVLATHLRLQFWHPGNYLVKIIVSEIAKNKFTSISL